jgi:uncharacterized peroxidase-related enzyme
MFLSSPPETEESLALYQDDLETGGYVMNLSRLWAWRPEISEAFAGLRKLLLANSSLSPRERAILVCAAAASAGDSYCSLAWGQRLAAESNPSTAAAVLQSRDDEALKVRERALAKWARMVVRNPNATTVADVEALRSVGVSDREIFDATAFIAFRLAFAVVNDALGACPDWQLAEAAPEAVRDAVTYGRKVSERGGA